MGELPPCLMQDELFLGWNLIVHFQLTAEWAELLFLLCVHSGFSGVTQGHTGADKLLVGAIPALPCETSLECGWSSFGVHVSGVTGWFRGGISSKGHSCFFRRVLSVATSVNAQRLK